MNAIDKAASTPGKVKGAAKAVKKAVINEETEKQ